VNENIDVLNMVNIPSLRRSIRIRNLCETCNLVDPYRILYPNVKELTFTPIGANQFNRSRLHFLLISDSLTDHVKNVIIPHSLSSTAFDHKSVSLLFTTRQNIFNFFVKDNYILEEEFAAGIHAAVVECYVIHSKISAVFSQETKNRILGMVGVLLRNLLEIHEL
jgi:hypothetical protein